LNLCAQLGVTVKVTAEWLALRGSAFSPGIGRWGFAHLKHYTAEYCEWGEGPPIVLVPGLAGGFELLGPLARILSQHFRVISYQLRGEDDCFALRQSFGMPDLASDLAEFLDWHCLENPAIVGVSFGGLIALELAARYPSRLRSLVVQGVGARLEKSLLRLVAGEVLAGYPLPSDNAFVNQFFQLLFGAKQKPGPLFQFVTSRCWKTDQGVMAHRFRMVERFDMNQRLQGIRVPSLILAGDRDLLVSERSLRELGAGIPRSKVVRLPGLGHLAAIAQPYRVADEVESFLTEKNEGGSDER
jgi:pimeloyl-ACP methyl ester carboxylesterase